MLMDQEKKETHLKLEKLEAKLKEWGVDLEKFRVMAGKTTDDARAEYEKQIKLLHDKLEYARKRLQELEKAGSSASDELKAGIEKLWAELKKVFDSVAEKFKYK
jgi:2-oxo-4-hydroxy-4-carboxy--5-ureidoimidazoline (OHCU) decarboxylase